MATKIWAAQVKSVSGTWSDATKWSPIGAPVDGDTVDIGIASQSGGFTVTEDATLAIADLNMVGSAKGGAAANTQLLITQPATLTVNGTLSFDSNSMIRGAGTLIANGLITGGGTIIAGTTSTGISSGVLDITGAGSIASGVVLDFGTNTADAMTLKLDLSGGVTSALNIKMNSTGQTLEVGPSTVLTISAAEVVSKGTLRMSGGTVSDELGITVGQGASLGLITGFGTIAANIVGGGAKGTTDTVNASGGTLDLVGTFGAGAATFRATIDTASASTLKFDGAAIVGQTIAISSAQQTLEVGAAGSLTLTGLELITNGTIKMDGGSLTDATGLVIDTAATLTGSGLITAGTVLSGAGIVKASGGTLELANNLTSLTTAFEVDTAAGSVLKVDGAVAAGTTLSFVGASGALELADVTAGVLQGFSGAIAGLNVSASATAPTNEINIQAPATTAVLTGSTLTIFNGATTVATLALSGTPVHGAYAVIQADATLGGEDVFLSNQPPAAPGSPNLSPASDSGISGDAVTNIARPVITGSGVAGDIVTLFDGATSVGSATVDVNGNWSITTATLPEGLNLITATQSDVFGNASAPSSALNITVDTIAPAVTARLVSDSGVSATDNITRSAALTGAGDANGIVTIRNGTTVLGSTTAGATGTWNFALLGLTDGTYSLTASESDLAGNTGATTLGFTLDTAAPAAPSTPDLLAASDSGASSTDNVTNIAAPTFSGTAEANTTVTLFDGATVAGSGVASATGAWAVTTGTLAGAVHAITARATDLAGNVSAASAALSVTIDSSAPTAPSAPDLLAASDSGTSSTDNVTNVAAPTFSGTAEANAAVTLFDGAAVVGSGVAGATGAWSVTSAGLADGVHTITAKATDLAGNVSAASAALSVTIDTSAPAAPGTPDLAAVSDSGTSNADNVINVTTPVFTGSAEANASVTVFDGATAVGTGLANAAGLWSVTTSPLANGVHAISAKATDIAGNVSTVSAALAVTIDTSAPAAPGTPDLVATSDSGASSTDNVTNVTTPVLSGTAEANATVTLFDGTTVVGTAVADATGAWSLTASTLAGGLHAISAKATDAAGNIGAASATLAVTIDTTAPAAPSTPDLLAASDSGASGTDNVTNVTTPVFAGTAEANATVTLFDGATVVGTAVADATGAWSVTTSALAGGVHAISAKATDLAGNAGATSAALSVTIDTAAPLAPSTPDLLAASDSGASSTDNVTNVTTPVFTGTAEANSTITLFDGATVVGSGLANGTGLWSVATGVLTNGVHSLSAKATDLAGNLSTASAALLVTIDATAPAAPSTPDLSAASDSGASTTDNVTNIVTPAFTGTAEANATVTVFDGTTVVGTTLANAAGAWSVTAGALAAGVHLITATATDVAGNASAASAALAVTIDTTAPVAPATPDLLAASDSGASNTDNLTNVTTPAFSGTAEANSTVTLLDGATVVGSGLADATGAWSVTASPLADGVHAISAKATDLAGNASVASAALAVTIDITPPVAPAIAKVTTAAISGAAEANSAITLFDGALQIGTGSANAAGTWSIPLALTSGTHTLIAKATDLAGNATASVALTAIIGTAADDLLSGGPGVITMLGTAGNDTYIVDNSLDVVTENAGEGSDTVLAGTSYTLAAGSEIEFLRANTTAGLTLTGNEFANTITGNAGNDTLIGGGGDDTFVATAGDGNDIYNGGTGIDTYDLSQTLAAATVSLAAGTATSLQTGTDTLIAIENVIGGGGNDLIVGSAVANILSGGAGDDNLKASGGDDTLFGGAGNDVLDGGTGADTMSGGTGDDIYLVDNVGDIVVEAFGEGNDTVNTTLNSYTLGANVENLKFTGTGNFIGTGNTLANAINGGAGDDMLDDGGVGGVDKLTGGAGNDTYVVRNTGDLVVEGALSGGIDTVDTTLASYTLGANVENFTFIGTGSFAGNGNALDNTIIGGAGADKLNGGAGNDIMAGGAGDDVYFVDSIGDVVTEQLGEGTDTVNTTLNSYSLAALGNVENLSFTGASAFTGTGNAAANVITGGAGNDTLDGGDGNDTLIGGLGADTMTGGAGDDTYVVDNTGDIVIEAVGGGTDTVTTTLNSYTLTANVENLTFRGIGAFAGTGNALANIITGGAGNDTLDDGGIGGAGDLLTGGAGNDTYIVNNVGDAVIEAVGGGTDTVNTTLSSYTLGLNVENLTFNGTGSFLGIGNAAANILTGGAGADNLKASGGNDTLIGGAGNDVLDGGTGADAMIGGAGDDTYFVDNAGDTVVEALGEGNDTVSTTLNSYTLGANVENLKFTGTGSFTGVGNTLANTIFGGAGDDALDDGGVGGTGDKLTGGAGNDTYVVRNTGDLVVEALNGGTDTVNTTLLSYTLGANVENLTFIGIGGSAGSGNALDNIITGGDGADTLNGGIGNDTMIGGGGNDIMTGGVGNDVFKYLAANFGADVITDFGSAPGTAQDLIDISGLGITAASFATSVTVGGGVNALITLGGGTITLTGVNQNAIDITDFKLA